MGWGTPHAHRDGDLTARVVGGAGARHHAGRYAAAATATVTEKLAPDVVTFVRAISWERYLPNSS